MRTACVDHGTVPAEGRSRAVPLQGVQCGSEVARHNGLGATAAPPAKHPTGRRSKPRGAQYQHPSTSWGN